MATIESEFENHPFSAFVPDNASTLIVGSFPGIEQTKNGNNPEEWFYSATGNLFWIIFSDVFQIELKTTKQKKDFLLKKELQSQTFSRKSREKKEVIVTNTYLKWNITSK